MKSIHVVGLVGALLLVLGPADAGAAWRSQGGDTCRILDAPVPVYEVGLGFVPESGFEGHGDSAAMELHADWAFAYFTDVALADLDLNLRFRSTVFLDSAGLELPDQVSQIALDSGWTWRYVGGWALQFHALPGMYSDLEEVSSDVFFMPVSLALVKAYNPYLSGIVGTQYRMGFEREFIPLIGLAWDISDAVRLDARLPESRLTWYGGRDWSTHLGFEWRNMTFSLREAGAIDRKKLTLEDYQGYWGLAYRLSDELQLTGEIGSVFGRGMEFDRQVEGWQRDVDIDPALFLRFMVVGPF